MLISKGIDFFHIFSVYFYFSWKWIFLMFFSHLKNQAVSLYLVTCKCISIYLIPSGIIVQSLWALAINSDHLHQVLEFMFVSETARCTDRGFYFFLCIFPIFRVLVQGLSIFIPPFFIDFFFNVHLWEREYLSVHVNREAVGRGTEEPKGALGSAMVVESYQSSFLKKHLLNVGVLHPCSLQHNYLTLLLWQESSLGSNLSGVWLCSSKPDSGHWNLNFIEL